MANRQWDIDLIKPKSSPPVNTLAWFGLASHSVFSLLILGFLGIFEAQMVCRCEHGMNLLAL
jgi:hypothetical protein